MPVLDSALDPRSAAFRANAERMASLVAELRTRVDRIRQGGGEAARAQHLARGKLLPRDRVRALIDPASPFLELGQLAAFGLYGRDIPRPASSRASGASGPRMHDRRQRRHREGRHLFPDDREEASARAGDRGAEPAALPLSGRFGRRQPAEPGRGLPGPRAFRPHLLQPGHDVGRRASPRSPS